MPKKRGPERDRAKEMYLQNNGKIPLVDIAEQIGVSEGTVRGWKSKDDWDGNGTLQSKSDSLSERSNKNTKRSNQNTKRSDKIATDNIASKKAVKNSNKESDTKTNSNTSTENIRNKNNKKRGAPKGNKNAIGNEGGSGGPVRNKHALKTGEYETIYFSGGVISEEDFALLNADYDKYTLQHIHIAVLSMRERNMLKRIKQFENMPGGMTTESTTITKGKLSIENTNNNKNGETWAGNEAVQSMDNTTHNAKPVIKQVMAIEEALTRIQAKKQLAIAQLHRMEMDDERLCLDKAKYELYMQRISGRVDIDSLFDDDDELSDLDFP